MKKLSILFLVLASACACKKPKDDRLPVTANEASAPTVVFADDAGGIDRKIVDYTLSNGSDTSKRRVTVIVPSFNCGSNVCAEVFGYRQDGTPVALGSIQKDENFKMFRLSKIVPNPVKKNDWGPYLIEVNYQVETKDRLVDRKIFGHIWVSVTDKTYRPVSCDGPDIASKVEISSHCEAQYTTKGRTVLCGRCD